MRHFGAFQPTLSETIRFLRLPAVGVWCNLIPGFETEKFAVSLA
jgi:hypothetical protein